jgi:hypothetical protein
MSGYTVVKRDGDKLVAVPYSVEYKAELDKAAALLDRRRPRSPPIPASSAS